MARKFKPGDRVRVKEGYGKGDNLPEGATATVKHCTAPWGFPCITIITDSFKLRSDDELFGVDRFELIESIATNNSMYCSCGCTEWRVCPPIMGKSYTICLNCKKEVE